MSNVEKLTKVLKVLEKYDLVDDTGHMYNCGYTPANPKCDCAALGNDLSEAISSR